jgi:hypothetical protein
MTSLNLANNNLGELMPPTGWTTGVSGQRTYYVKEGQPSQWEAPSGSTPEGAIALANAIPDMGAILSVNLLENGIGTDQAEALASVLKDHPTLKSLCGNKGDETELDMSSKKMGASDASMLAAEIVGNGALTSLDLSSNYLKAEGGKIVAGAIKVTKCAIAVVLAPFSCPSGHWLNCCCLRLSTG